MGSLFKEKARDERCCWWSIRSIEIRKEKRTRHKSDRTHRQLSPVNPGPIFAAASDHCFPLMAMSVVRRVKSSFFSVASSQGPGILSRSR